MSIKGIDISTYQKGADFEKIKKSVDFVIARASYGVNHKDAQFDHFRNELRTKDIPRGFYHYAYPQFNTPESEADWFLKVVGTPRSGEILVLDFEEEWSTFEDQVGWCRIFLNHIKKKLNGYKPLLYINYAKHNQGSWESVIKGDFGLWLALWDGKPEDIPAVQWPVLAMKQYSATGKVNGVPGDCDLDTFFGDLETFKKYGYKKPSVPPVIPPVEPPVVYNPKEDLIKLRAKEAANLEELDNIIKKL